MTRLAIILAMLITPTAWAQTTIDTGMLFRVMRTPLEDGGFRSELMPIIEVDYGTCAAMVEEAKQKMWDIEDQLAAAMDPPRTNWGHKSDAGCYEKRWTITLDPTVQTLEPVMCLRHYVAPFDWFAPCP